VRPALLAVVAVALTAVLPVACAGAADAATKPPVKYKNCAALNKAYKHGVGKPGAKDKVASGKKPVKNFGVNLALYNANKRLDRDKDGIACEKL
jgi:hypothetical protein